MYAIIATGGKQYKVSEGDIITIEKLGVEAGEKVTFDQVIAVSDNGMKVGDAVANAKVEASVVREGKAKKVIVYKYKRKTGYHKKSGHRQLVPGCDLTESSPQQGINKFISRTFVF